MKIRFSPSSLSGDVTIPPSKSVLHRAIICASLAYGSSVVSNVNLSDDIEATIGCMNALGASIVKDGSRLIIDGIAGNPASESILDCAESGSTLRFLIPIAAALGVRAEFCGRGKLPERPVQLDGLCGVHSNYSGTMPFSISGRLIGGDFTIDGGVSSQFVTGLLLALPMVTGNSTITVKGILQSRPYVDITLDVMERFGVTADYYDGKYHINGGQRYRPCDYPAEGDYSQAAFFAVANRIGSDINICGLDRNTKQGDKQIFDIIGGLDDSKGFELDASDIPDLVPILAVLGTYCRRGAVSRITGAARLRIKESDRLSAIASALSALGGRVTVTEDGLVIYGVNSLVGGECDSCGDHRIAMSVAIAALGCRGDVILTGAEAVNKSYPVFYEDYKKLGGIVCGTEE
ncbi:MAG: 3-phosphoshikimate 1-carboxyvinyltransferase [Oscillospiraceae bacterium]|nr:3-phosphoshikimate 1-carboxyvinyltransferase [Oscillospiraceae bacterium]